MRTPTGGRIDRARPLRFSFDGRTYSGFAGDTLASALLAHGVHLMGRSFKYHRPRGVLAAGSDEPNALVAVSRDAARTTPNLRATQVELYDGLVAVSQNRWPSLRFDAAAVNDVASPLLPAGFYYKTFMWPRSWWDRVYEPRIRAMAGLGRAPSLPDPDRYAQRYAHADVLVVGSGPAGLGAALVAADSGARVMLCDEQPELGGSLLADADGTIDGQPSAAWLAASLASLAARPNVTLLPRTTAFGFFPHGMIGLAQRITDHLADPDPVLPRERLWQVRAREVVVAAGAHERPLVFSGNDRPGILLADAARTYAARYGVRPGRRAVVVAAHDGGYKVALELHRAGVAIAAVADLRPAPSGEAVDAARRAGLPIRSATTVLGTGGRLRVRHVDLAPVAGGPPERVACDLLAMSGGWTPSIHLFSQSRGKMRWDEAVGAFVPNLSVERERSAGACRGVFGLAAALADGAAAGEAAAKASGHGTVSRRFTATALRAEAGQFSGVMPRTGAKAFVDFQNDVTAKDIVLATREGFRSIEHVKRYTTTGMATDQGKTSNLNALAIVAASLGKAPPEIGLTTFRMPYTPVTFGTLAGPSRGDLFDPVRTTPMHAHALAAGAVFEDVGLWKRARYFPRPGEDMHAAVARECLAVRTDVGMFDASTLGKIEVVGPDAAEFLNRLYINAWTKLGVGRARYGVLLREDGFVLDDGVVGRLAPDRFHVTTTTGGAPRVLALMEDFLQTEWRELDVWLTSTTEQWATIAVQGPRARDVLAPLIDGCDISAAALPHMALTRGRIAGAPMLLFRVSFTGELGFEVNVPAGHGPAVWAAIAASPGTTPYGTEAMHVLRAEKGYVIVGQETDGTATPDDAGLSGMIGKQKPDFVGRRSLTRPALAAAARKQLVGLLTEDAHTVLVEGAQVARSDVQAGRPIGHVTSAYYSSVLGHSIALAMVEDGRALMGQSLRVPMPGGDVAVRVAAPVFYDPEGARLNA